MQKLITRNGFLRVGSVENDTPVSEPVIRLNVDRMKEALSQPTLSIPMGLSREEKRRAMMEMAGAL
ncbi:hypothetical protein NM04_14960 [Massilia aurea]|uniref:Uncharacterized protein n=1 Tax=Massilia aurea TaxID=373040 RepID=A0A422QJ78_9BURK|nr:hypothetical protein [Massilia aurea]RNF30035.1 hypothetical protein NM04_14960 [Massilia aurea]